ncbi:MAG: AEC family transporter [Erysipelotrichia bacterium]|nr:AEC family transporter [Erysipelotrichia bacterium]
MVSMDALIHTLLKIAIYLLIGFICKKAKWITDEAERSLTNLILYIFMSGTVIYSFATELNLRNLSNYFGILLIAAGVEIFSLLLASFIYRPFAKEKQKALRYGTVVSNGGMIGLPIIQSLFGTAGALITNIYLVPQRIFIYTEAERIFNPDYKSSLKGFMKSLFINPITFSMLIGLLPSLFNFEYPAFILGVCDSLGKCTAPVSLIIVGSILANTTLAQKIDWSVLAGCAVRLLLIPITVLCATRIIGFDSILSIIVALLSGMPMASTTALMSQKYHQDASYASRCVFTSTVLSLFTIPIILFL